MNGDLWQQGLCHRCGTQWHSPGRYLCNTCHNAVHIPLEPGLARRPQPCHTDGCAGTAGPGWLRCRACIQTLNHGK